MDYAIANLPIQIVRQGRLYIAYSHKLDIATTGKSEKQAVDTFGDLIQVFMKDVMKTSVPVDRLTQLGWTCRGKRWSPPVKQSALSSGVKAEQA